jgi:hypothetical protein
LESLPQVRFPFDLKNLPSNGIYFFYEEGEQWSHGGNKPRIVRVGTHKDGNFRSRIAEHFLLNEAKMNFDASKSPPHDRSIFRKNIGRVLLNKDNDPYLKVWNIDFTSKAERSSFSNLRDIDKEKKIERGITSIIRKQFFFCWVSIDSQEMRMGAKGLERALIGTLASCTECKPSLGWLGIHSPEKRIRKSGLWLVQHLGNSAMTQEEIHTITGEINKTRELLSRK